MRSTFAGLALLAVLFGLLFLWNRNQEAPQTALAPLPGDGIHFGFIRAIQAGDVHVLDFDEARWLTGKEGQDAAIAAGHCTEDARSECLPNDFFIENSATSTFPLTLSNKPVIALFTYKMEQDGVQETQIAKEEFVILINDTSAHWSQVPYQMLVEQGRVTIVEEVYIP